MKFAPPVACNTGQPGHVIRGMGLMRALGLLLATLLVLALVGVVAYLLSEKNARSYRLALAAEGLVVERGRFLPLGFERYRPFDEQLRQAYAPIEVPAGETVDTRATFEERTELDRAIFAALRVWARDRLQAKDAATLELGIGYVKRLELLPGLSEGQRHDLRAMRADAALKQAEGLLVGVHQALSQAEQLFEQALELGVRDPEEARRGLVACRHKQEALGPRPLEAVKRAAEVPAIWPPVKADESAPAN